MLALALRGYGAVRAGLPLGHCSYGGMFTIALAYCATANNSAIRRSIPVAAG